MVRNEKRLGIFSTKYQSYKWENCAYPKQIQKLIKGTYRENLYKKVPWRNYILNVN